MSDVEFLLHLKVKAMIAAAEEARARRWAEVADTSWRNKAEQKIIWANAVACESRRITSGTQEAK